MTDHQVYVSENKKVYLAFFPYGFTISYNDIEWTYANTINNVLVENLLKDMNIYKIYDEVNVHNLITDSLYISVRMDENRIVVGSYRSINLEEAGLYLLKRLYE